MIKLAPPKWTTHFVTGYCGDAPTFYRRKFTHFNSLNEERLQPMYVMQWYDRGQWIDDAPGGYQGLRPISEYDSWDPSADCD